MEVWYTDKKKGVCHGEVTDSHVDYCGRRFFLVNKKWLQEDQLFQTEKELRDALDRYIQHARWDDLDKLGNVSTGHCIFRSTGKREWL